MKKIFNSYFFAYFITRSIDVTSKISSRLKPRGRARRSNQIRFQKLKRGRRLLRLRSFLPRRRGGGGDVAVVNAQTIFLRETSPRVEHVPRQYRSRCVLRTRVVPPFVCFTRVVPSGERTAPGAVPSGRRQFTTTTLRTMHTRASPPPFNIARNQSPIWFDGDAARINV